MRWKEIDVRIFEHRTSVGTGAFGYCLSVCAAAAGIQTFGGADMARGWTRGDIVGHCRDISTVRYECFIVLRRGRGMRVIMETRPRGAAVARG